MKARAILSALGALSPTVLLLALRSPSKARYLVSMTIREAIDLRGGGLEVKDAIRGLRERRNLTHTTLQLPVPFWDEGGTAAQGLAVLAAITSVTAPRRVFEIGTFFGLATTTFALNAPRSGEIITLDLPEGSGKVAGYLPTDADLVVRRRVGEWYRTHGLAERVTQLFGDSMTFDPMPYQDSVDLGFIDGAHSRPYVENDTRKMAQMMVPTGVILWHDYGGRGSFSGITEYLEGLALQVPIYREPFTSLAWAEAGPLKKLLA